MQVLYVAGWMRSGTTLLGEMLGAQPGVLDVGELSGFWSAAERGARCSCGRTLQDCDLWGACLEALTRFGVLDEGDCKRLDEIGRRTFLTRHLPMLAKVVRGVAHLDSEQEWMVAVTRHLLTTAMELSEADLLVDTSKLAPWLMFHTLANNSDVKVIHIVRDPRGVAASDRRTQTYLRDNEEDVPPGSSVTRSVVNWTGANLSILAYRRYADAYRQVDYESLVTQPSITMSSLCNFANIAFSSDTIVGDAFISPKDNHVPVGNPRRRVKGATPLRNDLRWQDELRRPWQRAISATTLPVRLVLRVSSSADRSS